MTLDEHKWINDTATEECGTLRAACWVRDGGSEWGGYSQWLDPDHEGRRCLEDVELLTEFSVEILRLAARVKELEAELREVEEAAYHAMLERKEEYP